MVRFLTALIIGWSISNWVMTEAYFFFPGLEQVVESGKKYVTIPRHDKWDATRIDQEAFQIVSNLKQTPVYEFFPSGRVEQFFLSKTNKRTYIKEREPANQPIVWDDFSFVVSEDSRDDSPMLRF